ncbi:translation initiation factor IF-2 [Lacibacter luteus]|uniref:Translation initiation factor IF-2 n=1 Tax=Lacibacter luteus TaxID=2508719 RepID=A0A4Q1CH71_9BACT|nr:translation initiation factor IF-2 [Lacibacter luteus]RXK59663.1 translation initiation factor IF-2 [Lacibacter luteus]
MSESNTPRLMAAAKEFNIGKDTLIDFLAAKGFSKDDLKPTAKLTEAMYRALQSEFSSDKLAKAKSDQIEIPKGGMSDLKKKKEEEEVSFKKEITKKKDEPKVEEVKPVTPEEQQPVVAEEVKPVVVEEKPPVVVVEETKTEAAPIVEEKAVANEPEVTKIEAPEVEGPKIIAKIDLDKIDSSTKPKKIEKRKPEAESRIEIVKKEEVVAEQPAPQPVAEQQESAEDEEVVIENIKADKLEGPKILGKIDLPVNPDTRPKPASDKEKRKRKRIPIDKKGSQPAQGEGQQGGGGHHQGGGFQNRGGQQHGGGNQQRRGPGGPNQGGNRNDRGRIQVKREDKVIDEKEIQEKLRETQAKLAGQGGRGKSLKAKYRKLKRDEMADNMNDGAEDNKLQVTEFVSAAELASLMDVSATDVVAKCFGLGMMVSINQRLDAEVIELVAGEFGFEVEFIDMEKQAEMEEEEEVDDVDSLQPRAPIVTIMGHVDHGKTSLLDYIRNANVVSGEAGGITQHIGAYEVKTESGKKITFLDTPGHEAFTAMRARGAKVTDIAVIVVAADDAVMPQTKEAISHAQAAGVPMIFAVNKIDKDGANPQKIYEQLSQMNILVEEWGGKFQSQELSAKKGLNVDKLLEKILLEAELLELKANPDREATGSIIEASLDKGRGYVATALVLNGTLSQGDLIVSGQYYGRVKAMFNERNQRIEKAGPSSPVQILGLNGAPQAGEKLRMYEDEAEAKEIAGRRAQILREQGIRTKKHITLDEIGRRLALGNFKELNLIIKGDVDGSVEALTDSLQKLSTEEIAVNVVHRAVGQISEADVTLASASDAILIGFNVRPSLQASRLAEQEGVEIKNYSIIYNAIEEVKSAMEGLLEPKITEKEVATVEIREVYKFDKATVAGCYVLEGKLKRDAKIRLFRDGVLVYPRTEGGFAELGSLKRFKDDAKEVASNMECGLTIKNFADLNVGDTLVAFEQEEVKRTL